jgi:hypothetical protein
VQIGSQQPWERLLGPRGRKQDLAYRSLCPRAPRAIGRSYANSTMAVGLNHNGNDETCTGPSTTNYNAPLLLQPPS